MTAGLGIFLSEAQFNISTLCRQKRVRVQSTSFGWRAGVIGAAALALNAFFYQQPEAI
jgi:hypothetical protein